MCLPEGYKVLGMETETLSPDQGNFRVSQWSQHMLFTGKASPHPVSVWHWGGEDPLLPLGYSSVYAMAQAMSSYHGAVKVLRLTANSRMCFSLKKIVILATVLTCTFCKLKLLKSITLFFSLCIDMWRQILKAEANNIFPWTTFLFNNRMNLF